LEKNKTKCFNEQNLNENELFKIIFTFTKFSVTYVLETKQNSYENKVDLEIPISLTQYIQVK